MAEVRLVDLEIIKRFSLAVRAEYADADELLEALEASRRTVERAARSTTGSSASRRGGSTRKATTSRSSSGRAKATTKRKTTAKRTPRRST
ncbi:MAG TPA: hypothetical protein VM618_03885 [Acidimicrobiia bacterium]|nr:hypothetical protein [Acidimicrobiia bacterium]